MPTITEIPAITWTWDADLDSAGLFASGYSADFVKVGANQAWDSSLFSALTIYRGESNPDLIRIRIAADGAEDILTTGVVDRKKFGFEAGLVAGVSGRDLMVLLLDRKPASPYTISKGTSALSAIARLARVAGLAVRTQATDYTLGRDIPVVKDRTLGEYIEELLVPLRWAERRRVDTWIEGSTVVIADRVHYARGTVTIPYDRVLLRSLEIDALGPPGTTVGVRGASYEVLTDAPPLTDPEEPGEEPEECPEEKKPFVKKTVDTQTDERGVITIVTVTSTTEYYDARHLLYRVEKEVYVTYSSPWVRDYEWHRDLVVTTAEFIAEAGTPRDGMVRKQVEAHTRRASWFVYASGPLSGSHDPRARRVKDTVRTWEYYPNGDVEREFVSEIEYHLGTGEELNRKTMQYLYRRSGDQILREWEVREINALTGEVERTSGSNEAAATSVPGPRPECGVPPTPIEPPGQVRETRHYQAGFPPERSDEPQPDKVFQSDLIGSDADCEAIRALILEDYSHLRVRVSLQMLTDVRLRPGMRVVVSDAPAYWPTAAFYVTSVQASGDGTGIDQTVVGVAWVA